MRYQGKITNWNDDLGFGYVIPDGGGEKVLVHLKAFSYHSRRPMEGDFITYELPTDVKRRFQAERIRFSDEQIIPIAPYKKRAFSTIFTLIFCSLVALAVIMGKLPIVILGAYCAASILTFIAYAIDKSAAQNSRKRIQESTLHIFGMIGGWPGALLAQKTLRHKLKKKSFQIIFWATVGINCFTIGWLLTKNGSAFLRYFFVF